MTRLSPGSITIQHDLGTGPEAAFQPVQGLGVKWDWGINGLGYLLSTLGDESPFEYRAVTVRGAPQQKPRIDTAGEPGEQTLEQWWARAQHSWHAGAGQKIFDSIESDRSRFWKSKGVDIWTKGQVSLLRDTLIMDSDTLDDLYLLSDAGAMFLSWGGDVYKITDPTDHFGTSVLDDLGGPVSSFVQSMTSDGQYLYVCWDPTDNAGIRRMDMTTWTGDTLVNDLDPELIEFVKARLIAAKTNSLYDIDIAAGTTAPAPHYTHPITNWRWTSITGSATSIYVAGFSGERSEIYAIRLDATDLSAGMTLGVPIPVWQAPDGEVIYTIEGYLGKAILIGTSRGLRFALIANVEGELDVSRVLVETPEPVKAIEPQGDYAWFGWSNIDANSTGLGRLDLATLAYASDLQTREGDTWQGTVQSIASFNGEIFFTVRDAGVTADAGLIVQPNPDKYVEAGWYETGEVRFDTFENKHIQFFDTLMIGVGSFDVEIKKNQDAAFLPVLSTYPVGEVTEPVGIIGTRYNLKITLRAGTIEAAPFAGSPIQLEWRLRAEPHTDGRLEYMLPLMAYDSLVTRNDQHLGHSGMAKEIRDQLVFLWRTNSHIIFESRDFGTFLGQITGIEFKSFTPPRGADGMGGIVLIVVHEQE